jgi:hypothetical protein
MTVVLLALLNLGLEIASWPLLDVRMLMFHPR